jgi:hypothetical protein
MRGGGVVGPQPMSTAVQNAHGDQINFEDLTPYLIFGLTDQSKGHIHAYSKYLQKGKQPPRRL